MIYMTAGTYFNQNYNSSKRLNQPWLTIDGKTNLTIQAAPGAEGQVFIKFDGSAGISVKNSFHLAFRHLDISGPNNFITGREASLNRQRQTSRNGRTGAHLGTCSVNDCNSCGTQSQCNAALAETGEQWCKWDTIDNYCYGKPLNYYQGQGFTVWAGTTPSQNILVEDCKVSEPYIAFPRPLHRLSHDAPAVRSTIAQALESVPTRWTI